MMRSPRFHSKMWCWLILACGIGSSLAACPLVDTDLQRAATRIPGDRYRADSFVSMSATLNRHLKAIPQLRTLPCRKFSARAIQAEVLEPMFAHASPTLLSIYALHNDGRQRRHSSITDARAAWDEINGHVE